jgi:NADH-quinone oxidoreductase subunit N
VIIAWTHMNDSEEIADFKGMRERAPLLSAALVASLFSLAGLPLVAGFFTKFILFQAATNEGYYWLAAIGVVTSVISLYYYLQVMREAFVSKAEEGAGLLPVPAVMQGLALALTVGVFYVGVYPQQLFDAADNAASFLFV